MARESAPTIIFMDEIDSIGSTRMDGGSGGGDSEVQRTMLELLNQLDGFEPAQNIKVIPSCFLVFTWCCPVLCVVLSCLALCCIVLCCPVLSCCALSCRVVPCLALPYLTVSYLPSLVLP
jgi:hypothetical protein